MLRSYDVCNVVFDTRDKNSPLDMRINRAIERRSVVARSDCAMWGVVEATG